MLVALAEPNRLRIVELLGTSPRTVGEIASALDIRQPQVTKHLQTLERAGLVEVYPLGRRRVCALRRAALAEVAQWSGALAVPGPDDAALDRYRAGIAAPDPGPVTLWRSVTASRTAVWRAFTDPALAARWWHPRHFTVSAFGIDTRPGGAVELVLREGDGSLHRAAGRVQGAERLQRLTFTLDPLDGDGAALMTVRHDVHLRAERGRTRIELTLTPSGIRPGAEPAVAGLGLGWEQLLDNLAALADTGELTSRRGS